MAELKVLVVDDEPGIRSGIVRILKNFQVGYPFMEEAFNFSVIESESGEKALQIINQQTIDIVLLDNKLPGIEGIEVLEIINRKNLDIFVMMITSYATLDLAVAATKNGAYNFVQKPFTPEELRAAMESITKHLYLKGMTKQMSESARQLKFEFLSIFSPLYSSPLYIVYIN